MGLLRIAGKRDSSAIQASDELGTALFQQLPQHAAMTAALVLAIAADRKIGARGQRREEIERPTGLGSRHLLLELPHEPLPLCLAGGCSCARDQRRTRGENREPDIIVVALRDLALGNAARRP